MSVKVMGKVWDTDLPPNLKLVLLAYADAAEHDGFEIRPGHERLTSMTGYSRSQVERITRALISAGVLIRVQKGYRGRRARFAIPLDHAIFVSQDATQSEAESVADGAESVATDANELASHATRPVLVVPSSSPVLKKERPRDPWWDYLVGIFGAPTKSRRSLYNRVLKTVKEQEPEEIPRRVAKLVEMWGQDRVTITSLETHWSRFDAQIGQVTDADVGAFTAGKDRKAMLERLADDAG